MIQIFKNWWKLGISRYWFEYFLFIQCHVQFLWGHESTIRLIKCVTLLNMSNIMDHGFYADCLTMAKSRGWFCMLLMSCFLDYLYILCLPKNIVKALNVSTRFHVNNLPFIFLLMLYFKRFSLCENNHYSDISMFMTFYAYTRITILMVYAR